MIRAVIFDFDGLIVDTEGPIYRAWQRIYRERGHELPRDRWLTIIGTTSAAFDPLVDLGERMGETLDKAELDALERLYYREATVRQELLPGVGRYLQDARQFDLKTGIASSSSRAWVMEHLARLGVAADFDVIVSRDDVLKSKPDPELYQLALARLQVRADEALALEDSHNGVRAAKAAGIFCVAVPNPLTATQDLRDADLRLPSLEAIPLADLIVKAAEPRTR
jgi:HAD superfamily hydrolase (TIGR01509 family)